ncbi:MAG: RDD family protein [Candidatus Caldarchaeum sp.]
MEHFFTIEGTKEGTRAPQRWASYAEFGTRFLSGLIDVVVLIIPTFVGSLIVPVLGCIVVSMLYFVFFMTARGGGKTLGDRVMRVKTVDEATGEPMELSEAFIWALVYNFVGWIGWVWYFFDPKRRMLHNIASKTVTLSEEG